MLTVIDRIPMSRVNVMICALLVAGIIATAVLGLWPQAALLGLALAVGGFGIYRARRPDASEVTRVDAIEYRDERDRLIARRGFAVVGMLALTLSLVEYVLASVLFPEWIWAPLGQSVILCIALALGNRAAARRH